MNDFSKLLLPLITILFSCSYRGTINPDTNVTVDKEYDLLRQNLRDSLEKGLRNVNDFYKLYTYSQRESLDSVITRFEKHSKLKISLITFDSIMTSVDSIEGAIRIIGIKNRINTTIGISPGFKKLYIWNDSLVNKTLFNQYETKEVIENKFIPSFKVGNFYQGTLKGLEAITTKIEERLSVKF